MSPNEKSNPESSRYGNASQRFRDTAKRLYPVLPTGTEQSNPRAAYFDEVNEQIPKDVARALRSEWVADDTAPTSFQDYLKILEESGTKPNQTSQRVVYLTPEEREDMKLNFDANGKIIRGREGILYDTINHPDGTRNVGGKEKKSATPDEAAFVIIGNDMYALHHITGLFQHTTLSSGGAVNCAGLVEVRNGEITKFTNKSGHYGTTSKTFQREIISYADKHPSAVPPNAQVVDNFRPCYFDPVLSSASNMFIHKFGEALSAQFSKKIVYKSIDEFRKADVYAYTLDLKADEVEQKIAKAIQHAQESERKRMPEGQQVPDRDYAAITSLSKDIIGIQALVTNTPKIDDETKKSIHDQLSNIFHLKLESIAGNEKIGALSTNAVQVFYEKTLNGIEDPETREVIKKRAQGLYQSTLGTYIQRDPDASNGLRNMSPVLCTEMPEISKITDPMMKTIKSMREQGYETLANQFNALYESRKIHDKGRFIDKTTFHQSKEKIVSSIRENSELASFISSNPSSELSTTPIFQENVTNTPREEKDLVLIFADQVESLRIADLRHVAKKGETLDKGFKLRNYLPPQNGEDPDATRDFDVRLKATKEVIDTFITDDYIQQLFDECTKNAKPGTNKVTILRPTKDYSNTSNSFNVLTNMTADVLSEKLNSYADAQAKDQGKPQTDLTFEVGTTQMLTTTNRTDADLIGRLIKQPYFADASAITDNNLIICDDHSQAGAFTATLTNFANSHGAKVCCVATCTSHPSSSESIYAKPEIVENLKKYVRDVDRFGKPLENKEAISNLETLLNKQGLSLDTLTNGEALILTALFMTEKDKGLLSEQEKIANHGVQIIDGKKDSLSASLDGKKTAYTVSQLEAEINKRLQSGERVMPTNLNLGIAHSEANATIPNTSIQKRLQQPTKSR